jgi:hypothetical protein
VRVPFPHINGVKERSSKLCGRQSGIHTFSPPLRLLTYEAGRFQLLTTTAGWRNFLYRQSWRASLSPATMPPANSMLWLCRHPLEFRFIPGVCRHQLFYSLHGANSASGSRCRAVQRGRGAGEVQRLFQNPALQQSVDKARVEDIAGSGCIDRIDTVGRPIAEPAPVVGQGTIAPEGRSRQPTTEPFASPARRPGMSRPTIR